ncbi:UDP-3-O-(3-hydroxymyristoyl)glucosamine N-acyltransferase [Chitinophaga sp. Cy-1792]|uniref:UDP-3-O-(3-hydroxymyristoyl)glucosamine N-acyltransferase n=1 Tax=Chitinophaga sp. Cy-1792 TaxID=2608339 RepID=UPI0014221425|nr:UDP-3-O-(3-hydroxymyristoyl)glucosamine N-acyltransferase [Chitinophaga sp. Cy-1792]NIG52088.1 UDP-3-O-(3-hydroxymyristoyl)glucosamine N-acyltransferase [Chitinophaga sp. Cy-1792]
MLTKNKFNFKLSEVVALLDNANVDRDLSLNCLATLNSPKSNGILFVKGLSDENLAKLETINDSLVFINSKDVDFPGIERLKEKHVLIFTPDPRLSFAKFTSKLSDFAADDTTAYNLVNGSYISASAVIGENVVIEPGSFIGHDVKIGKGSRISSGARISNNVTIGNNCYIGYNTVVGGQGFGGERDEDNVIYMIPHLGGVVLDDYVQTGAFVTIVAGTIDPTFVGKHTKIDDHVHVAHNCQVGESCFVTACAQFGGSDRIGHRVWVGPNASFMQNISIGDNTTVGLGAVVTKSVEADLVVLGNPAEDIRSAFKKKKLLEKILKDYEEK